MKALFLSIVCVLGLIFKTKAQDNRSDVLSHKPDSVSKSFNFNEPKDTSKKVKFFMMGHEKGGAVCVNGLEKFEIAFSTHKSLTAIGQLHFYGPLKTEGRVFMIVEEEQDEIKKDRYFGTTVDLTWKSFPLHIGCKSCHGSKGLGDGPKSKELDTPSGDFSLKEFQAQTDGELFYKIQTGRDDMPSFKKKITDDEDIWNLVNYMRTFAK